MATQPDLTDLSAEELVAELATIYLDNLNPAIRVALFNLTRATAGLSPDEKGAVLAVLVVVSEAFFEQVRPEIAGPSLLMLSRIDELLVAIHGPTDTTDQKEAV